MKKTIVMVVALTGLTTTAISSTLYRDKSCGCCKGFVEILRNQGVSVKDITSSPMSVIKHKYKIPANLQSCHTLKLRGYVMEGHIPMAVIKKVLTEKPNIYGIALSGMPMGSPGMGPESLKQNKFTIYSFDKNGNTKIYTTY